MHRTYGNIKRLRHILSVFIRHGFSHVLHQMRVFDYVPRIGRLIEPSTTAETGDDLPRRLAHAFQELGPTFIKLGQLLATRPDIVPAPFQAAFAKLQDNVIPLPGEKIVPILASALGRSPEEFFSTFDTAATAAGSIGQVHLAVERDGTAVVVKIRRPGIERLIQEDLALLETLGELVERYVSELAVIRPLATVNELRRVMESELDFIGEASRASKFRESLGENPGVVVPRVRWDLVTREVLVTERLSGRPLSQAEADLSPLDRREIAAGLADCFLRQYFVTGFFHADPHPGNIFILPSGEVGLIDFGQVGHLPENLRYTLGQMLLALKTGDIDGMVDLYAEIGEFSSSTSVQSFRYDLGVLIDRNWGVPVNRIDFSVLSQELLTLARRNGVYLRRDFVLIGKSFVTIAGVIRSLDPDFRLDQALAPFVRRLLIGLYHPAGAVKRGWRLASRFMGLIRRVPEDARDLLEKARAGKLTIVFHHENLNGVAERAARALDRLTMGIVIAALVIAGSIVFVAGPGSRPAEGGVPPVGIPLATFLAAGAFLGAILLGAYVLWGIFHDRN
jgi:ubiquinone biosynthesis protein